MGIRLDPETHQLGTNPRGLRSGIWGQGWGEGGGTGPLRSPTSRLHRLQGPREGQGGAGDGYISGLGKQSDCPELSVCEDEGDIIGIRASAEPGNEWRFKYQDAKFTKGIGEREGGEAENVGRELWREKWKGSGEGGGEIGRKAKGEGSKGRVEGRRGGLGRGGERDGGKRGGGVGEGRGRTGNQGRKDADTARPGGACRVGSLKRFQEVANTFQAAGRERRACRYFWRGVQLGGGQWQAQRLGWAGQDPGGWAAPAVTAAPG